MNLLNDVNGGLFLKRAGGRLNLASPLLHTRGIFWGRGGISLYEPHPDNLNRQ